MRKTKFIIALATFTISTLWTVFAAGIPDYYRANYSISSDWENIKKIFIEIEANNQIWEITQPASFVSLNNSFNNVFPKFPQEYSFQIVYEKCKTLSQNLWAWYNSNTFASFMDNCFKPLSSILNTIDSSYTVKPSVVVNPSNWPAPLTVTFNGSASVDPSSETIPENNYFRYYRDVDWVDQIIWNKSVISYTFEKPGNHIVHLTVRSSNYDKWIFDGWRDVTVSVKPMSAAISVYANWKKLNSMEKLKFWTQEWLNWIVLDWSATIPLWWRVIQAHSRKITWWNWFSLTKNWEWTPGMIKVVLPNEWEYKIMLTTKDNEWNEISESFSIVLADPVAIIKSTPEDWTTSTKYVFDASSSYSVTSNIKLYTREIFDINWNKMTTYQWKSITYQFIEPGSYTIKLTVTDNLWESNIETKQVYVESSTPVAQFTYKADSNRTYPSKFVLDASSSSDIDVTNSVDTLYYSWLFSNPETTTISEIEGNNKKVKVSFDSIWEQKVKLTVTDKYWKTNEIEKTINVQSTLRPEIAVIPRAISRWNPITFIVQSNQKILSYSWKFWDWWNNLTQTNKITHTYNKVWVYNVSLNVEGENWNENSMTEKVFIWEKNYPIAWYKVRNSSNDVMREKDECKSWNVVYPAYKVSRYETITIDPSDSVNTKWTNANLKFFFQPKYSDIFNASSFKHSFSELWCTYIDMQVEDTAMWLYVNQRIRFKVYNSLPTFDNISLSFPQYWNDIWIWFTENNVKDIFNSEWDLTVKVTASNARDADWFISYYKRYYYHKDDPSRRLETKITPSNINYTYFQLKEAWEYMFGVTVYDNDEWKTVSEELLWNWPTVLMVQDTKNIDIPIVTLRSNRTTVDVWDEVTFDVISKIISDRADFTQERTIRYDFDWDWERDLITKDDHVTHVYEKPNANWYIPRVWVLYRWYEWTAKWWSIVVKDALKPRLLIANAWKFVIFRDISLWAIEKSSTCLSLIDCNKNNDGFLIDSKNMSYYTFEYPEYQKYFISMDLQDEFANTVNKRIAINLTGVKTADWKIVNYTWDIKLLTIPEYYEKDDWTIEIFVWNNLKNSVLFYVLNEKTSWVCYVDLDITDEVEKDFSCNEIFLKEYTPQYTSKVWRIYYEKDGTWITKEFSISFLDYSVKLTEDQQELYDRISELLKTVKDENLKVLLLNLQEWLVSEWETEANTIALHEYLNSENQIDAEESEIQEIGDIVDNLSDSIVISAIWWTEYDTAKAEILWILPRNLRTTISRLFSDFEVAEADFEKWNTQLDERKQKLQEILTTIQWKATDDLEHQKEDEITKSDLDEVVVPNICKIMNYYEIASSTNLCWNLDLRPVPEIKDVEKVWKSKLWTWLKVLIISLSSLIWIFLVLVIFFAVKAKINRNKEEDEE